MLVEQAFAGIEDGPPGRQRNDLVLPHNRIEIFRAKLSQSLMQPVVGEAAFQRFLMPGSVGDNGGLQFVGRHEFPLQRVEARRLEGRIFVYVDAHDAGVEREAIQPRDRACVNMCQPWLRFLQLLQNFFLLQSVYQHHFCNSRCQSSPVIRVECGTPAASFITGYSHSS